MISKSLRCKISKTWKQEPNNNNLEESIQYMSYHRGLWLVENMAGRRVWGSDDHSPKRDKRIRAMAFKKKSLKHSNLLCIMVDSIFRMSISVDTIIMCLFVYLKSHHRKRPRVPHKVQVPISLHVCGTFCSPTNSNIITLYNTALIFLVI